MHHSAALIVKRAEWGESDAVVAAFTEWFGKIRVIVPGARKHGAKLQGHIEPGTIAAISFVAGRSGYRMTTARSDRSFAGLHESLEKLRAAFSILRLIDDNAWEDADGAADIFGAAREALTAIETCHDDASRRILLWFAARMFLHLGVLPEAASSEGRRFAGLVSLAAMSSEQAIRSVAPLPESEFAAFAAVSRGALRVPAAVLRRDFAVY